MMTTMANEISSDCFARRCQIPSTYASPYTSPPYPDIPNQPNSTPSSSSQYYSDSDEHEDKVIRSNLELEDYMNDSALSVDGEFDVRIDIISMRQFIASTPLSQPMIATPMIATPMIATAPPLSPLSDCESDDVVQQNKSTTTTITTPYKEDYRETCIICYEDVADVVTEESKITVVDFCRTCKYNVHLDCIDEYRVNKLNDAVAERGGASISSSSIGIKCLMCAREVERIFVRRNGDIDIVKTQIARSNYSNDLPLRLSPQQRLQRDLHHQVLNNMERRMRRERRNRFKQKCCNFCFFTVLAISVTVILIMRFA
jgi:hypothetical protein